MSQKPAHSARAVLIKTKAQAALEMGVALVGAFLLLWGSVKFFVWVNDLLAKRQKSYETSRLEADKEDSPLLINIEKDNKLNFFGDAQ